MQEQTIFTEALEKEDLVERATFLDGACANDPVLRQRIEKLLERHQQGNSFLESPVGQACSGDTQGETHADDGDIGALDILVPSDKPGALGRLGHYEVLEVIGRGGMGIVLRAFDEKLHRVVAIKVMAAQLATNANARKRFTREAQAAAAVTHDHLVTIHAVEEGNGLPYLVMQFVSGMSLQQRLDRDGPLQLTEIVRIGLQTAAGLAAAHAHGLIHRDIKPANILLENGVERVKITDFGLARAVADASLTQSGVVAGTPQYMSPEQARGEAVDQRTDLFSLGSVLYAMCTGRPPFRADSAMGVLKRVCDDTPRTIGETNLEIPGWLVAIVTKLHAKDPAERFQSAAEVAELLKDHLAHLQHPSVIGPVAGNLTAPGWRAEPRKGPGSVGEDAVGRPGSRRRRWAMAAAALLSCVVAGLGFTEATSVTHLRAAWIRFFTPEGALARQEADLPPVEKGDKGAFVLLAASQERKFDTLVEAVKVAHDGDTIEVRGNGPFVSEPIHIKKNALTIRAAPGFRPVIRLGAEHETGGFLLASDAPLVLEGLELRRQTRDSHSPNGELWRAIVYASAPSYIANCRFLLNGLHNCIVAHSPILELRNCEFVCTNDGTAFVGDCSAGQRWGIENCVQTGGGWYFSYVTADRNKGSIRVVRNTMMVRFSTFTPTLFPEGSALLTGQPEPPVRVEASGNVFDTVGSQLQFEQSQPNPLPAAEAEAALRRLLTWEGRGNLYASEHALLCLTVKWKPLEPAKPVKNLADWKQFWGGAEVDSLEGQVRYQGGDLRTKLRDSPEKLTPDDFRLRPDSAGYRAGKDGKDLGADIDLVGPGLAYERWKKTLAYQQWLKDTAYVTKAAAPKAEPQAFVVLGANGAFERKFATLADAVQGASAGDTIEIRGNGPFVTKPIRINIALTIRAGEGFRPVIKLSPTGLQAKAPLLEVEAVLVLEGLELQRMAQDWKEGEPWQNVLRTSKDLHVANCRFLSRNNLDCIHSHSPVAELRNCEFLCQGGGLTLDWTVHQSGQRLVIDNCLLPQQVTIGANPQYEAGAFIQLTRNTSRPRAHAFLIGQDFDKKPSPKDLDKRVKRLRIEASGNIFDASSVFGFMHAPPDKILPPREAEIHVAQTFAWEGERNLYTVDGPFVSLHVFGKGGVEPARPVKNLADWRRFWATAEANSIEGPVRYQGGDILAKLDAAPEQLTPEDFRLRPDSPGYKAGKDGKDLGADVDLVGPGPAYERWKKTPEYQQWLKDTKQVAKAAAPKAFVLLGGKGVAERKFGTLAEAVLGSSDGDTIEVRGNGPFVSRPIDIKSQVLTIRAGAGFRPVVTLAPEDASTALALIATDRTLTLEGLELQRIASDPPKAEAWRSVVFALQAPLYVTNCRFLAANVDSGVSTRSPICEIRNSQLAVGGGCAVVSNPPAGQRLLIENCLFNGGAQSVVLHRHGAVPMDAPQCKLTGNTFAGALWPIALQFNADDLPRYGAADAKPLLLRADGNVIDGTTIFCLNVADPVGDVEKLLPRLINWQGDGNLYSATGGWLFVASPDAKDDLLKRMRTLADWRLFWKSGETESVEGRPRYEGGDLHAKLIGAEDARLRRDSAGYRAGKNGKDLGADIDLVGPGPAYERWKKTPEYQQWLKETKQVTKTEASTAEPKAFVVLTGKGVEVRRYDTLAEAVRGASDGDTIEIRSNGTFVTEPINIKNRSLIIRAGEGYRPVLKQTAEAVEKCVPLLETSAPLVLEGLELQQVSQTIRAGGLHHMLISNEAPLWMANCRLFMKDQQQLWLRALHCPTVELRNCEFFTNSEGMHLRVDKSSKCLVSNCVQAGGNTFGVSSDRPGARENLVRLEHNTLVTSTWLVHLTVGGGSSAKRWGLAPEDKLVRIKAADNILDAKSALTFSQYPITPPQELWSGLKGQEAETEFKKMVQWDDGRNVFTPGASSIGWLISGGFDAAHGPKSLSTWKRFWGNLDADLLEGQVRYQGGSLSALLAAGPEKLTAEHFRLRPDSAGYRAGKDGKDLGADIDLVGPGPAYERWKKTPAYQQWLKDSGQVKK